MKYISEENFIKRVAEIQKINSALGALCEGINTEIQMLKEEQKRIFAISDALDKYVYNVGIDSGNTDLRFSIQLGIPSNEKAVGNENNI